jgi:hypothetical protein
MQKRTLLFAAHILILLAFLTTESTAHVEIMLNPLNPPIVINPSGGTFSSAQC